MQSDTSKSAVIAALLLATFSCAALAAENQNQIMITKAPPKAQSKYTNDADARTNAMLYRYKNYRTTPGYITSESSTSLFAASSAPLEHTGSVPPGM
jgi:hypothetical protein